MNQLQQPILVISLDLELAWGSILNPANKNLGILKRDPKHLRGIILDLVNVFEEYEIPATWAIVGHLFFGRGESVELVTPDMPQFEEGWLDWKVYEDIINNPLYYGNDIVEMILTSEVSHEIGLHGFSHIPFEGCSWNVAMLETQLAKKAAEKFGLNPRSWVFPQNKIGYVDVLVSHKIEVYRRKHAGALEKRRTDKRISIIATRPKFSIPIPVVPKYKGGIWELPSSSGFGNLCRARLGLHRAILSKGVFHIWFHPRNILEGNPKYDDLKRFLSMVASIREKGKLEVKTMIQLIDGIDREAN